ncbi:MAG: DoxX family protein [Acidobacteria bacterium]|nr:DoxX family protein [Acidobacteriota bacterium]
MTSGMAQSLGLSLLRMVAGFTFSLHGAQKVFGVFGGMGGKGATAAVFTQIWTAGVLEAAGGALILLGLCTRPVAFVVCGEMAVAYFRAHAPRGFWPILNGGELAALYCFIFLYLVVAGAGPLSLDRLIRKK